MRFIFSILLLILFSSCNEQNVTKSIQEINGVLKVESVENDIYTIRFTNTSAEDVLLPAINPSVPVLKIEYFSSDAWVPDHMKSSMVKTKFRVKSRESVLLKQKVIKQDNIKYRLSIFLEVESSKLKYKSSIDI